MGKLRSTGSTEVMMNQIGFIGLSQIGHLEVNEKIREWDKMELITKKEVYDLRRKIKAVKSLKITSETNELISKLDFKIQESISFYR